MDIIMDDFMDLIDLKKLRIKLGSIVLQATKAAAAGDLGKVRETKKNLEELLKKYQLLGLFSAEEINQIKEAVSKVAELEHYCIERKQKIDEQDEKERLAAEEEINKIRKEAIEKLKEIFIDPAYIVLGESNLDKLIKQQEEEIARLRSEIQSLKSYYQELEEERAKNRVFIEQHKSNIVDFKKQIFDEDIKDRLKKADPSKSDAFWDSVVDQCVHNPEILTERDVAHFISEQTNINEDDAVKIFQDAKREALFEKVGKEEEELKKGEEKDKELTAKQQSVAQQIIEKEEEIAAREAVVEDLKQQKADLERGVGIEGQEAQETQASYEQPEVGQVSEKRRILEAASGFEEPEPQTADEQLDAAIGISARLGELKDESKLLEEEEKSLNSELEEVQDELMMLRMEDDIDVDEEERLSDLETRLLTRLDVCKKRTSELSSEIESLETSLKEVQKKTLKLPEQSDPAPESLANHNPPRQNWMHNGNGVKKQSTLGAGKNPEKPEEPQNPRSPRGMS